MNQPQISHKNHSEENQPARKIPNQKQSPEASIIKQPTNQKPNQMNQSTNKPIYQSTNQATTHLNKSTEQSNPSVNQ